MSEELQKLEQAVKDLYAEHKPERADWSDWLGDNHVFIVADYATELADRYGADPELARAAALLHDIADTKMKRHDEGHEEESLRIGRELMQEAGFSEGDIKLVVDDAVRYHSCREGKVPDSLEGKVLATADSMAHLKSDFYVYATWVLGKEMSLAEVKDYVLKKIDRDLYNKVLFDEVKEELKPDYAAIKEVFSR